MPGGVKAEAERGESSIHCRVGGQDVAQRWQLGTAALHVSLGHGSKQSPGSGVKILQIESVTPSPHPPDSTHREGVVVVAFFEQDSSNYCFL